MRREWHTAPALRPGDRVAVVAPAGPVPVGPLRQGLAILGARYRIEPAANLFDRRGFFAGSDARRVEALRLALRDPDIRAVFCARGGTGTLRLLPDLDPGDLIRSPKVICGFSDVTALLHWALAQGVPAVHGPVVTQLGGLPARDLAHLFRLLEDPGYAPAVTGQRLPGAGRPVQGPLVGGNLTVLTAMAGTDWAPDLDGSVLLLEDVGERPYRLDRALTQLWLQPGRRSLRGVAGVAVGELRDCQPLDGLGPSALEVIVERVGAGPARPLLAGLPVGHGTRNLALALGAEVELDPGRATLRWQGGLVH